MIRSMPLEGRRSDRKTTSDRNRVNLSFKRLSGVARRGIWVLAVLALMPPLAAWGQFLSTGDIAITGMNMTDPNEFAFVALVEIPEGTEIFFTDNGWTASGTFRDEEDTMRYVAPGLIPRGTVVVVNGTVGRVPGLGTAGDQLFAYQISSGGTIRFLYGINNTPLEDAWQQDSVSDLDTALPTQLADGFTAVSLPHCDNVVYIGVATGRQSELLALISDPSGWICQNAFHLNLQLNPFDVTGVLNAIPTFTHTLPDTTIGVGQRLEFNYEATDPDGQVLLFAAEDLPAGAFLAPTTGLFVWTPVSGQVGTHTIRVRVSDGIASTLSSAVVTVATDVALDEKPQSPHERAVLDVWPNPAPGQATVHLSEPGTVMLYDVSGRRVRSEWWPAGSHVLDTSSLPPGLYRIVYAGRQHSQSSVFVVSH
ncbi:MAG: hypothetical protein COV99_10775 [Bacteroidetes bacterium CG12_big_fil_rev_8_21_14_0_65_60_17]|nr:MAG: hypothetical protein COV99_10775 [Bacteroidetes bacterium CG12_big_fil_rev_8_21_14_0_65_60_17]